MPAQVDHQVTTADFRKHFSKYVAAARKGRSAVAVADGEEVVGFFVSKEEYEALYGAATRKLLRARMRGPTVSHEEARARLRATVHRAARKS